MLRPIVCTGFDLRVFNPLGGESVGSNLKRPSVAREAEPGSDPVNAHQPARGLPRYL